LAALMPNVPGLAGLVYFLLGPAHGYDGLRTGCAIERAASALER